MRLNPTIITREIDILLALCPDLADDEQLRHDMIEGETEAFALLSRLVRRIGETKAMAAGTADYCKALAERRARLETRIEAYRSLAHKLMEHAKLRKAELPEATLSIGKGRRCVVINDESSVPEPLCVTRLTPDKDAIREAIEAGANINWAAIVEGDPVLSIRTK